MKKMYKTGVIISFFLTLIIPNISIIKAEENKFQSKIYEISDLTKEYQTISSDFEFSKFSLRIETNTEATNEVSLQYSTSSDNTNWSSWQEYKISNEIIKSSEVNEIKAESNNQQKKLRGDDADTAFVSDNIDLQDHPKYLRIKLHDKSTIKKYSVFLINDQISPDFSPAHISTNNPYNFDYLKDINVITRAQWGCPDNDPDSPYYCNGGGWYPDYFPTSHIIIHHTASNNHSSDWKSEVRGIWYHHSHVRDDDPNDGMQGWGDIGYNFLIDPNGDIYEGRYGGEGVTAGHALYHNRGTVGISLLGTYSDQDITPQMRNSLEKLVTALSARYKFNPHDRATDYNGVENYRVSGHRDWESTGCPGNVMYSTIPNIQENVSYYSSAYAKANEKPDVCPNGYTSFDGSCAKYIVKKDWADTHTPVSLAPGPGGKILSASFETNKILSFSSNGDQQNYANSGNKPRSIVSDSYGNIFIANYEDKNVTRIDKNKNAVILGPTAGSPFAIAVDNFNNVYTANVDTESVTKITPWGQITDIHLTGLNPVALATDNNGNIYTANYLSNSLSKITRSGEVSNVRIEGENPMDMVSSKSGEVFVANYGSHTITKVSSTGEVTEFAVVNPKPVAITLDENNYLYTAHENSSYISRISPSGNVDIIGTVGTNPKDILASNGNIYTANIDSNSISQIQIDESSTIPTTEPIYRFWSNDNVVHFYTSNLEERNQVIRSHDQSTWAYEGTAFYSLNKSTPDARPVHRFWNASRQKHFYTINETEKEHVIKNDPSWTYEGVAYYAYASPKPNSSPIHRFWSVSKQSHFFTINEEEKNHVIQNDSSWSYEGIGFYLLK